MIDQNKSGVAVDLDLDTLAKPPKTVRLHGKEIKIYRDNETGQAVIEAQQEG